MKILKKLLLIISLIAIIVAIVFIVNNAKSGKKENKTNQVATITSPKMEITNTETATNTSTNTEKKLVIDNQFDINDLADSQTKYTTTAKTLDDGTKYSIRNDGKMDIVVGDNYFDTQISDMSLNFDQYEGKTIEIEGMYFENSPYTFVGRFSTSNMCPTCPTGYSYFEYEWHGDEELNLTDSENWIKVKGTLTRGDDNGIEYYYIDASSIEIMNEMGVQTVSN